VVKIGQKYLALYMKIYVSFIVASDITITIKGLSSSEMVSTPRRYKHYMTEP